MALRRRTRTAILPELRWRLVDADPNVAIVELAALHQVGDVVDRRGESGEMLEADRVAYAGDSAVGDVLRLVLDVA